MRFNLIFRLINWFSVFLSCFTMSFSPLALGRESERLSKKNLELYIQEFGLDKKTTLGEFWNKSKTYYPGFIYKDLEKFVNENKNLAMPVITVSTAKATDGSDTPVLKLNSQGSTAAVQIYGEKNKWAKYNVTVLSENDLRNVSDVFKRVEASDIRLKREADKFRKNNVDKNKNNVSQKDNLKKATQFAKDFSRFEGFPRITPLLWKSLTKEQRAGYIIKMRLMWESARQVLDQESEQSQKTSSAIQEFYKNIFAPNAFAVNQTNNAKSVKKMNIEIRGKTIVTKKGQVVEVPYNAKTCVVAGYIGAYGKVNNVNGQNRDGCSVDLAVASYKDFKSVQEANESCVSQNKNSSAVACNPIIYGYPKGSPICLNGNSKEFQEATHYNGPCDQASRLASTADVIKFTTKNYSEIEPESKRLEMIELDQKKEDYQLTKDFLNGVLLKKDPILKELFEKGEWSLELDNKLVEIQTQFEEEIRKATDSCRASIASSRNEKNQKQACDQLHRRWLFTEKEISKLRSKACDPGSDSDSGARYIGAYESNELVSSSQVSTLAKTKLNKQLIDQKGTNLCECTNVKVSSCKINSVPCPADQQETKSKLVSFGEKCLPPVPETKLNCPEPMVEISSADNKGRYCACAGKSESVTLDEAIQLASSQGEKLCQIKAEEEKCPGKPKGIDGYDYETCGCLKGDLVNENEPGFFSKVFHADDAKKEPKWVCKESSALPWILGGLGLLALIAIFNRSNSSQPAPPPPVVPPVCNLQCSGNTSLNAASCKCTQNPPSQTCAPKVGVYPNCSCPANSCVPGQQVYDQVSCTCTNVPQAIICPNGSNAPNNNLASCPKCSDGSYKESPSSAKPDGCAQKSEGGSGNNTCTNPPCSGGVPTKK